MQDKDKNQIKLKFPCPSSINFLYYDTVEMILQGLIWIWLSPFSIWIFNGSDKWVNLIITKLLISELDFRFKILGRYAFKHTKLFGYLAHCVFLRGRKVRIFELFLNLYLLSKVKKGGVRLLKGGFYTRKYSSWVTIVFKANSTYLYLVSWVVSIEEK